MSVEITWLGHATWLLEVEGQSILLDPFLSDSPVAKVKANEIHADFILVSHGHFDHVQDAAAIANRCNATVVTNYEIATWLQKTQGVKNTVGMNIGGSVQLPFGRLQLTMAWHSSALPDGSYGGTAGGFFITCKSSGLTIYFACDTGLFGDMRLIGNRGVDVAVLPIGDLFTMGPEDALEAVKLISPKKVLPSHFGTWSPIEQDAAAWAVQVREQTSTTPVIPQIGEKITLA